MKLLTTTQACAILNVHRSRVRQLILRGQLPATKTGRDWLIRESDLELVKHRPRGRPKAKP